MVANQEAYLASRAVQYVRMSTEHQRYSIENQSVAIAAYAADRGLKIVRTYADPGRSGLTLKERPGLQRLLSDAVSPHRDFGVILVLDVSRWGRFQDIDQAAHYEFLCREAGARVLYCGEPFENDGGMISSVLKHLKRVMAAEYSRELSVKLVQARLQQARLGFRQGGIVPFGFRRLLVDADGTPRQILDAGREKALRGERVRTAPGPEAELDVVRGIFRAYVEKRHTFARIARDLNAASAPSGTGLPWEASRVGRILRNELYVGNFTFNKVVKQLRGRTVRNPESEWIRVRVCDPIVDPALFDRAQKAAVKRNRSRMPDAVLLERLRSLLERKGRLSPALIDADRATPHSSTYEKHFGTLTRAYTLIGYEKPTRLWRKGLGGYWTDEAILAAVRALHARRGHVTCNMLKAADGLPSYSIIRRRFGSLRRCYEQAGLPHELPDLVSAAQLRRRERLCGGPVSADMLEALRTVWKREGRLSTSVINGAPETWSASSYCRAFGSLRRTYELIGYVPPRYFNKRDASRRTTKAYMIEGLRRLLAAHGYLDGTLVDADPELPTQWAYRDRFGSMLEAYRLAGWNVTRGDAVTLGKQRIRRAASDQGP